MPEHERANRESGEDPDRLADELERETRRLERESDRIDDEIADVRQDWERKRADEAVPGAPPPEGESFESGPAEPEPPGSSR